MLENYEIANYPLCSRFIRCLGKYLFFTELQ